MVVSLLVSLSRSHKMADFIAILLSVYLVSALHSNTSPPCVN